MDLRISKSIASITIFGVALLLAEPAAAFRCGSKLVIDGMHEQEVIAVCGEPASRRMLGYAIRSVDIRSRRYAPPGWTIATSPGYGMFSTEVMVTEYVYNFGPRKLMRRLVFEDGFLVTIETLGHGHN